ncbi:MAG: B12-binding domain-containing radical SAM protein [Nanoarchaeota archaeon]|nr:B12-binding domain-containing radical SAM protein [Nanoarchaeota archaeon]MCG2719095.1 B12-binding domain-containing radical SAM protein [Nanoarchaeota archaeon]
MKVVLCSTPQTIYGGSTDRATSDIPVYPKFAIVSLLKWMEKYGYHGDFYDIDMLLPTPDEMSEYFKTNQPDVVGLSAIVSASYLQVKTISNIVRKAAPSAWIVLGGNMAAAANVLLRKTGIDICFLGDGEKSFVAFLDYVKTHGRKKDVPELSKIKGIAFLNNENEMEFTDYGEPIPDNENPMIDYDLLAKGLLKPDMIKNYFRDAKKCSWFCDSPRVYEKNRKPNMACVFTSKGCVNRCTFCQRFCKGYHVFDPEKFDKHLTDLKEKYDVQLISFQDENFGTNKKHSYEIAKTLKKHDFLWITGGLRCGHLTLEDLKFFKECGCIKVGFGVESGSDKILKIMEKRYTVENIYTDLKNRHECGLDWGLGFCVGMPGETDETIMESGKFLGKIALMQGVPPTDLQVVIPYVTAYPGTPLYEYALLQCMIENSVDGEESYLISVSDKYSTKYNFLNLTGMSPQTVLFWDYLLRYEAIRTYYSDGIKKGATRLKCNPDNQKFSGNKVATGKLKNIILSISFKKLAEYLLKPISSLNEFLLISNIPILAKLPRSLIYVPMRNLLYMEYKMQVFLGKRNKLKMCKPKPLPEVDSLRKINEKLRATLPPPKTLTEKNQRIILLGR